jgi:hypothetical protein
VKAQIANRISNPRWTVILMRMSLCCAVAMHIRSTSFAAQPRAALGASAAAACWAAK